METKFTRTELCNMEDVDFSQCDFPAAHSMDTTWFAVDKDGFIAVLETNEEGALPIKLRDDYQQSGDEFVAEVAKIVGFPLKAGSANIPSPQEVGLYSYSGELGWSDDFPDSNNESYDEENDEFIGAPPYKRLVVPAKPIHISALSEQVKAQMRDIVFHDVSFKDTQWLQPALRMPCDLWMEKDYQCIDEQGRLVNVPAQYCPPGMAVGATHGSGHTSDSGSTTDSAPDPEASVTSNSSSKSDSKSNSSLGSAELIWKAASDALGKILRRKK